MIAAAATCAPTRSATNAAPNCNEIGHVRVTTCEDAAVIDRFLARIRGWFTPMHQPPCVNEALWQLTRLVFLPLLTAPPMRLRRINKEALPRDGAVLVVANHVSIFDPIVVAAACRPRRVFLMAKEELFANGPLAWWLTRSGGFPVKRASADRESIRTARELLANGECLILFPEGGVTRSGIMQPGFSGAGALALQPNVTVVPCVIWDTQLARGPARVRFGEPISLQDLRDAPRAGRNREATERIMAMLAAMLPDVGGPIQAAPVGEPSVPLRPSAVAEA